MLCPCESICYSLLCLPHFALAFARCRNKKLYFNQVMKIQSVTACKEQKIKMHICKLHVKRDYNILQNSFTLLNNLPAWELLAGPIRISYLGEDGLDAGGLAKDWFVEMSKALLHIGSEAPPPKRVDPNSAAAIKAAAAAVAAEKEGAGGGASVAADSAEINPEDVPDADADVDEKPVSYSIIHETEQGVAINPTAGVVFSDEDCQYMYGLLGTFIAKALIDGQTIGIQFHKLFLLALLSGVSKGEERLAPAKRREKELKRYKLSDLEDCEPQFYAGLKWIADNSVEGADITFSTAYEAYVYNSHTKTAQRKTITVDLVEGGDDRTVTDDDKDEYLALMLEWLCKKRYEPFLGYVVQGVRRHLPHQYIQHFTVEELGVSE